MNARPSVAVVGAGGHAVSVSEAILAMGLTIAYYVSHRGPKGSLLGLPIRDALDQSHIDGGGLVVLAIGDNAGRARAWQALDGAVPLDQFPAIIHPSATVAVTAETGPGTVVLQGAILGAGSRAETGSILNTRAALDHESRLGAFSSLAPGAVTGGRVSIGRRTAICLAASLKQGVTIGDDTVVGAASYVNEDLPSGVVAYGVPARVIRSRAQDEPYLH